jgi:hypothetical protein
MNFRVQEYPAAKTAKPTTTAGILLGRDTAQWIDIGFTEGNQLRRDLLELSESLRDGVALTS